MNLEFLLKVYTKANMSWPIYVPARMAPYANSVSPGHSVSMRDAQLQVRRHCPAFRRIWQVSQGQAHFQAAALKLAG